MAYSSLKLLPGVNENTTPALNEAGISYSNLIRFISDGHNGALPQKLGGWTAYYQSSTSPIAMASITRALWPWEDTNAVTHLAVGMQSYANNTSNNATFTATIAASSSSLVVSSVSSGTIYVGMTLGTITGGTFSSPTTVTITGQVSGTSGGAGTYSLSQTNTGGGSASVTTAAVYTNNALLNVITNGSMLSKTPRYIADNVTPTVSSTAGSTYFVITDSTTTGITQYDTVYIATPIAVAGVVLFGLYACDPNGYLSSTQYTIQAANILGSPQAATLTAATSSFTASITGGVMTVTGSPTGTIQVGQTLSGTGVPAGTVILSGSGTSWTVNTSTAVSSTTITGAPVTLPLFTVASGSSSVTVTLPNHGYSVGSTFPVLASTTVAGVTFYGNYVVTSVIDTADFTIAPNFTPASSGTGYLNNGNALYIYGYGVGSTPTTTGYGIGGYGSGGYGTGSSVVASTGYAIPAVDWTLDNWGEILVACPIMPSTQNIACASFSGTGSVGAITLSQYLASPIPVGSQITLSGWSPSSLNTVQTVTASTTNTISFSTTTTTATVVGTVTWSTAPYQPIYQWNPLSSSSTATVIPNAPPVNDGMFVAMPQRQIIAWGSTFTGIQDPLLIRWCDVNNFNSWVGTVTNQAGSYRLPKGSKIVGAMQGPQQGLVWTDLNLWAMQYVGQPYVYSFNEIGSNCGLIARKAAGSLNGVVYWMGPTQFYRLSGGGVEPILCPIWDVIFQELDNSNNGANLYKIRTAVNARFEEITWYYPTVSSGGEVTAYAKYNSALNIWDYGTLGRSAWIDQSVLGAPIGADPQSLYLYQHETSNDAAGTAMQSSLQTGYFAISESDEKAYVDQVRPDMKWGFFGGSQNATVNLTFYVADYAGQTPQVYGPYAVTQSTQYISPRFRGRLVSVGVSSNDVGSFWRLGNIRYRVTQDGKF